MSIANIVELIGSPDKSWEDAAILRSLKQRRLFVEFVDWKSKT